MKLHQSFAILSISLLLVACGDEGAGTLTVKGAGSASVASSLVSFNENFLDPLDQQDRFVEIASAGAVSPGTLELKIYELWISSNPDCSNPELVFSDTNPSYKNVLGTVKPDFGTGSPVPGAYPCLIMNMSDNITLTTASGDGDQCAANTSYTFDVCAANTGSIDYPDASQIPSGSQIPTADAACSDAEQIVPVYLSTFSTATSGGDSGHNGFSAPTTASDSTGGFNLSGALNVANDGKSQSYFVVDGTNKVVSQSSRCDMQPPNFGFVTATIE